MTGAPTGDRITIVVRLPADAAAVAALLVVLSNHWPDGKIDTSNPDGWRIETPPT